MAWIKNHVSFLVLVLALGSGAALHLSGKLRLVWNGQRVSLPAEGNRETHGEHEEHETRVVDGKVVIERDVAAASGISTAPVTKGSVSVSLRVTGEVQVAGDRVAHVTPRIPGAIRAVHKTLGDDVSAGTSLCTVESVELGESRAAFVSAISERTLNERNYDRWKQLYEKGLKTQNELWAAESALTRAKLGLEAALGKLKALGITDEEIAELEKGGTRTITNRYEVKSSIAGTILDRHATLGENVEAKDQVFLVADLSEVWVQAAVYLKDLSALRPGMVGAVRVQGFPDATFKGQVAYVGQRVDEKSRTVPIRVTVKNEPIPGSGERFALRPGMFATVDIETARKDDVLVLPLPAVQTVAGEAVVFVQVPAPTRTEAHEHAAPEGDHEPHDEPEPAQIAFERRPVVLGERDAQVAEVVRGIQVGDLVVVKNAYLLKSEFERSRIAEGHQH